MAEQKKDGILDLMLCRIPGLSSTEKLKIAEAYTTEEAFSRITVEGIGELIRRPLRHTWRVDDIRRAAEKDLLAASRQEICWTAYADAAYPPLLREIFDPPAVLFYRGRLPNPEKPLAAVVGTRHPSSAALVQTAAIARDLGRAGIPVVSGLALGIDAMAHRGNLEGGGPTVAVLGSALDMVYPASNRDLARRLLQSGGALLSEYPPGTGPARWNFPARNRIISALARGVVIVEAPASSGALITAGFALEQGRDLWVASSGVTVQAGRDTGAGTRKLAAEGAKIIHGAEDILAEWNWTAPPSRQEPVRGRTGAGEDLAAALAETLDIDLNIKL